jgi:GT2 family glycosyltransferase
MSKKRVLLCITVYNGRAFVPRALESAMGIDRSQVDVDVLVLDDASPEPGWSADLKVICEHLGVQYYLTPRNLGIPRNVSLGLLTAVEWNYDFVVISNSDVMYPKNVITQMVRCFDTPGLGSVTAWSNNVSIYSLPNSDPDHYLAKQETVDWVSSTLEAEFKTKLVDIPAGISFCIMMPTSVVRAVGVMDPCFGRGYCEETDWSLRSLQAGYRLCLAPGVFVYHQGRGSNLSAGLLSGGQTTVPQNEAIIDLRYPDFRKQVQRFVDANVMQELSDQATSTLIRAAAQKYGFSVDVGWLKVGVAAQDLVHVRVGPEAGVDFDATYCGFYSGAPLDPDLNFLGQIEAVLGARATCVRVLDRGIKLQSNAQDSAVARVAVSYPTRV